MATLDKIRDAMRAQPFRPFDLKLVDGTRHAVKHPDYITLSLVTEVVVPSEATAHPAAGHG
ncbi:MAG: hypothetical protein ACHRXM_12720 [Isosphaerales bacterium]